MTILTLWKTSKGEKTRRLPMLAARVHQLDKAKPRRRTPAKARSVRTLIHSPNSKSKSLNPSKLLQAPICRSRRSFSRQIQTSLCSTSRWNGWGALPTNPTRGSSPTPQLALQISCPHKRSLTWQLEASNGLKSEDLSRDQTRKSRESEWQTKTFKRNITEKSWRWNRD